nr:CBS domain-containing protein [Treponema sp.]
NSTRTIFDIMLKKVESIGEGATLEAALRLMTERGLKRIPIVDDAGKFKGMLRRDTVLLAMTERT